jgi:low temperature requirement protein LtrA
MTERGTRPRPGRRTWHRPLVGRSADEEHRAATPLELFFDLCFVVAVAQASAHLHDDLSKDRVEHGVLSFALVFFAIWWAWMNFTWFASAYDNDDLAYRLATLVQIAGALTIAAGVPRAFDDSNFGLVTVGYAVMRLALVTQWLRAAREDPARRPTTVRFAVGVTLVQIGWLTRLELPEQWFLAGVLPLVAAELIVPIWAERVTPTTWHPQHIAERYGQFTLIVLGESVLAASIAMQVALDEHRGEAGLVSLAIAGIVIVFSMWWLYFDQPAHELLTSLKTSIVWGYGHYVIFASAAAVGAGLAVSVDYDTHAARLSGLAAGYAVALPAAAFLLGVWVLHVWPRQRGLLAAAYPLTAALVLAAPATPAPVHVVAVLLATLVLVTVVAGRAAPRTTGTDGSGERPVG